jgi:lysophospholipase L1-like esterase
MPYLVAQIGTGETGWIVRESENGRALDETTGWNAQLTDAIASVEALDDGPPDLIYVPAGANDAGDADEAGRAEGHIRRTLAILRDRWPLASIVWLQERTTATPPSAYDLLETTIHDAISTACAEVGAYVVDGPALEYTMADDIHASQDATGQGAIAAAIAALWSP